MIENVFFIDRLSRSQRDAFNLIAQFAISGAQKRLDGAKIGKKIDVCATAG